MLQTWVIPGSSSSVVQLHLHFQSAVLPVLCQSQQAMSGPTSLRLKFRFFQACKTSVNTSKGISLGYNQRSHSFREASSQKAAQGLPVTQQQDSVEPHVAVCMSNADYVTSCLQWDTSRHTTCHSKRSDTSDLIQIPPFSWRTIQGHVHLCPQLCRTFLWKTVFTATFSFLEEQPRNERADSNSSASPE